MADNLGKLILRMMLGGMILFHGIDKAVHGISFIKGMLKFHILPEVLVYSVYVGEILAPIFLIIGWKSRVWAWVIGINMAMAIYLTHMGSLLKLGAHGVSLILRFTDYELRVFAYCQLPTTDLLQVTSYELRVCRLPTGYGLLLTANC